MDIKETQISVFFSWQSASLPQTNTNFIENCLKKAVKEIAKENSIIIKVDRDTKGVGGSPGVVATICKKIRSCDVFVWDGTIINDTPRYSPNPNVLFELGYAFAAIGEGRIIGIMNVANGFGPENLPFDFIHRRWPIRYKLDASDPNFADIKKVIKKDVVTTLKSALIAALKEPRSGINSADIDFLIGKKFWDIINSEWINSWLYSRRQNIQYEMSENLDLMETYKRISLKPENLFVDEKLKFRHDEFIQETDRYIWTAATQMMPVSGNDKVLVINAKGVQGWVENYDEMYDEQIDKLLESINSVEKAWQAYVHELRIKYPEITNSFSTLNDDK